MKKIILSLTAITGLFVSFNQLNSNPTGGPAGYSGSPADGQTCGSGCHNTSVSDVSNVLTSNVPSSGYIPGQNYTITVTVNGTTNRKGFQVSPQDNNGTLIGSIAAGSGSRITGTKYITHSSAKTSTSAVWTFTWTAPTAGKGAVKFYGVFVNGYSNISKQVLTVEEQKGTSTWNIDHTQKEISVFPSPAKDLINVAVDLKDNGLLSVNIIGVDGKTLGSLFAEQLAAGKHQLPLNIADFKAGVYFLEINANNESTRRKILVN